MERRAEVNTFLITYKCDKCLEKKRFVGDYTYVKLNLETEPPLYEHQCNLCGKIRSFDKKYPIVEYEEISMW